MSSIVLTEPTEWSHWDDAPGAAETAEEDDSSNCYAFRSIQESDRERVKELHEEWFPVV